MWLSGTSLGILKYNGVEFVMGSNVTRSKSFYHIEVKKAST